ncbi:MAG: hypothetical protein ACE5FW_03325, partial [Candidatus Aenigmatarchaeota archaeon]
MKRAFITLDCDPSGKVSRALDECFRLFEGLGLEKAVTWFVNEPEVRFTERHQKALKKMCRGELGLHVHLNRPPNASRYVLPRPDLMRGMIKEPKARLEAWLKSEGLKNRIVSFRSGNLLTNRPLFSVLAGLGFRIDSSVPAQFDWSPREVARKLSCCFPGFLKEVVSGAGGGMVYPTVPVGTGHWSVGGLLEAPVHVYAGGRYADLAWLEGRTRKQLEAVDRLVVYWHPHELLVHGKELYKKYLTFLMDSYSLRFLSLSSLL